MTAIRLLLCIALITATRFCTIHSYCTVPVDQLTLDSPVPVRNNQFITPQTDGTIRIRVGETLDLFCSRKFRTWSDRDIISLTCQSDDQFSIGPSDQSQRVQVSDTALFCTKNNNHAKPKKDSPTELSIGYYIGGSADHNFQPLIRTKFDPHHKRTIYAYHVIEPVTLTQRFNTSQPSFRADLFFGATDTGHYSQARQPICDRILHLAPPKCDNIFDRHTKYLARGHLAPAADFFYLAGKWASYSLVNAAPQWQQLNGGPWKKLENGLRDRCANSGSRLHIFTGSLRTLRMQDNQQFNKDIFLNLSPQTPQIPVPEVMFKVVLNTTASPPRGVVFLALNNPYANADQVTAATNATECNDVADQLTWPMALWHGKNGQRLDRHSGVFRSTGYMWACEVQPFTARHLPAVPIGWPAPSLHVHYDLMT